MPAMLSDLGLTMSDVGILGTLFYITYGCSKFISGMISDRSNPRYFMGLGLIMTGVLNIFFGLSSSLLMLGTLWILNAFFGGWGWPPCSKSSPAGIRAPSAAAAGGRSGTPRTTSAAR